MATQKKYVSLEKLGLYDDKIKKVIGDGDAATLQSAKDYADSLATEYDVAGAAKTVQENLDAEILRAKAAEEANATAAKKAQDEVDALELVVADKAAQSDLDALESYVGTIPEGATATNVVAYVQEKTAGIATEGAMTELNNKVTAIEGEVNAIKGDYLKAEDKEELAGDIADVQAAVEAEADRADKAEKANAAAIKAIQDDYLKAADKTALQDQITTNANAIKTLTDGVDAEKVDGVRDLIAYVEEHGTEVTGMKGDITQNATDIAVVAGRMDTAEGKIEDLEDAVATKVEQSVYDEKIAALEGADTGLGNRIAALEGKFGGADGSVEDMIADAKAEAIATAGTDADTKDEAILAAAKRYADDEDAKIESRVDALESIEHHDHANKAELDLIATGDKAKWDAAAAKAHEHGNKTVLDGITAENVTTWNTVTSKAAQSDLEAAVARIAANEAGIAAFVEVSEQEILDLFN